MNVIESRRRLSELAAAAQQTVANKSLTNTAKKQLLDKYELEMKSHVETLSLHDSARRLLSGGSSMEETFSFGDSFAFGGKQLNAAPKLNFTADDLKGLHQAAYSKQNFRVEAKASDPGALLPTSLLPGVVGKVHEPSRILDYIPSTAMSGPSVEFISHTSTTGTAAMVASKGTKPETTLTASSTILVARKIAVHSALPDEILADFPAFSQYLLQELQRQIADVENTQILSGDGTGENLQGILTNSGIITRLRSTDTHLDAVEQAIKDLRVGSSYCTPDLIVLHPTDFSTVRRSKDSQNQYLLNPDPSSTEADNIWGIPVLTTTTISAGTGLIGNFGLGAQAFIRQGFTLEVSNNSGTDWTTNLTRYRAEERLTLGVSRPSAFVKITGL